MSLITRLDGLEARLRDLLVALDGARTNVEAIEQAWKLCSEHGYELDLIVAERAALAAEERRAVDERLARMAGLNAVALHAAQAEQARLLRELQRFVTTHTAQPREPLAAVGESCDVSG